MSALGAQGGEVWGGGAYGTGFQTLVMTKPCLPYPTLGKAAHRLMASKVSRASPGVSLDGLVVSWTQLDIGHSLPPSHPSPSRLLDVLPHQLPS